MYPVQKLCTQCRNCVPSAEIVYPVQNLDKICAKIVYPMHYVDKFSAKIDAIYQLDSYETRNARENKFLRLGIGLTYRFNEWMRSELTYNNEVFDSNKGNIDYKSNRVMLGLSVGY